MLGYFGYLKNIKVRILLYFFLMALIIDSYIAIDILIENVDIIKLIFIFFVFLILVLLSILTLIDKKYILLLFFFIANMAFTYGRIIVESPDNVRGLFFAPYYFSIETYVFIMKNLYINLAGIVFGLLLIDFFPSRKKHFFENTISKIDTLYYSILFYMLLILTGISLFFIFQKVQILYSAGYLASRAYNSSFLSIYSIFLIAFIGIGLSLNISKKFKDLMLYLFLFNGLIVGLQGARGGFVITILIYYWYKAFILDQKIEIKKFLFIGIGLILSVALLSYLRSGSNSYIDDNFWNIISILLSEQGSSIALLGYYKDYSAIQQIPHAVPYIFGIIYNVFLLIFDHGLYHLYATNASIAEHSSIVGQRFGAILNPSLFERGAGVGGNYIVEEYDLLGYFGVFSFTGLYVFFINYIQNYFKKSNRIFLKTLIFVFIYLSLFMPRTQYLTIGVTQLMSTVIVFSSYFIFKIYLHKNKRSKY